jgi:hypothetical protein
MKCLRLRVTFAVVSFLLTTDVFAQFDPQVGLQGSTAIHRDSSIIKAWAIGYSVKRGWQNCADTILGKATAGNEESIPGKAGNGIVSLGDGGEAILHVYHPVMNGPGYDFVIFENGFLDQSLDTGAAYLELAFVEVSSDGIHYFRFPASCLNDTLNQLGPFSAMHAEKINNLAGKYIAPYGTPFDLDDIPDDSLLNKNAITHIRVMDVVGSLNDAYCTRDTAGNKINDPWPTPFPSSGFDLDALGVIHQNTLIISLPEKLHTSFTVYPNPAKAGNPLLINKVNRIEPHVAVFDMLGNEVSFQFDSVKGELLINEPGMYHIRCSVNDELFMKRVLITP